MGSQGGHSRLAPYAEALREMTFRYEHLLQAFSILRQMEELDDPAQDIGSICRGVLETIASGLAAENCSLMLKDASGESLELRAACSPFEEQAASFDTGTWAGRRFKLGEGIVGKVAQSGESIHVEDVLTDENFVPVPGSRVSIRSLLSFPLRSGADTIGVLNLSHSEPNFFSVERENTLHLISERAARLLSSHLIRGRLMECETLYRFATENTDDAVLVFDPDGDLVTANPAVEAITGLPADRFVRENPKWEASAHPDDRERYLAHWSAELEGRGPGPIEYRYLDSGWRIHHLVQRSAVIRGADGQVQGVMAVVRDVTDHRELADTLALTRTHLDHMMAAIGEVVWLCDPRSGRILYVSPRFESLWGRPCDVLMRQPAAWLGSVHPEDQKRVADCVEGLDHPDPRVWEYRIVRPDGSERWVRHRLEPVLDAQGEVTVIVGVAEDISQSKGCES
ncbi:MAG: PAS domain-containing protein [bacterium]|nr:PAS domain-containing protein [bacterium]